MMAMSMVDGMSPVTQLIAGGALMKHPDLKFVVVECGAGWLAWLLYVLDEQYDKKHMWIRPKLDLKPSEYFARQGHVTFSDDPMALRLLDFTGADKLMWGSDYPHDEGTFPSFASGHRTHLCRGPGRRQRQNCARQCCRSLWTGFLKTKNKKGGLEHGAEN